MHIHILFIAYGITSILLIFYFLYKKRRWVCTENNCELSFFNGKYKTKKECETECNKENFGETSYVCSNNNQCIEVPGNTGDYTTFESCRKNCDRPEIFYPQRIFRPWWGRRWFRRW